MPFERPTLPELIDQGATEIESRIPGVLVRIRRSLLGVLNRVFAGALSSLYQYAQYLIRQAWPDTCDVENLPTHGARWGVPQNPAEVAGGTIQCTGANDRVIVAGTQWQRADGVIYTAVEEATTTAGAALVKVAAVDAGQAGNASVGTQLTLSSPVAGVNSVATATTALEGGTDLEDPEEWRARILERVREVPQGGAEPDYVTWAKQVSGVTRVWVYPGEQGPGSVVVRFVRDNDETLIPGVGEVADVQTQLNMKRPVTATVYAVAPIAAPVNFSIRATPNTLAVRTAIAAELASTLFTDAEPGGTLLVSHLREAISIAPGETDHELVSPAADLNFTTGQMPTMGTIAWLA